MNKTELAADIQAKAKDVLIVQKQPYTFCHLAYTHNGNTFEGYGFSKVCHPDVWNARIGLRIARRRALSSIFGQVMG